MKFLLKQQVEQIFKDFLFNKNQETKIFKDFQFLKQNQVEKVFTVSWTNTGTGYVYNRVLTIFEDFPFNNYLRADSFYSKMMVLFVGVYEVLGFDSFREPRKIEW